MKKQKLSLGNFSTSKLELQELTAVSGGGVSNTGRRNNTNSSGADSDTTNGDNDTDLVGDGPFIDTIWNPLGRP